MAKTAKILAMARNHRHRTFMEDEDAEDNAKYAGDDQPPLVVDLFAHTKGWR